MQMRTANRGSWVLGRVEGGREGIALPDLFITIIIIVLPPPPPPLFSRSQSGIGHRVKVLQFFFGLATKTLTVREKQPTHKQLVVGKRENVNT